MMVRWWVMVVVSLFGALLPACGGGAQADGDGTVLVMAAASLTDAFADLEVAFEADNPGIDIVINPAASSTLREQLMEGAPADVFAPADRGNMDAVVGAGVVAPDAVQVLAANTMALVVPADNPGSVTGIDDLADPELLVGLCAAGVPCGDLARRVLANAEVTASIDSDEPNVRALLAKVTDGELDVGIVYASDAVTAAGAVATVPLSDSVNVTTEYPIAVTADAPNATGAEAFVAFVLSDEGRAALGRRGFATP